MSKIFRCTALAALFAVLACATSFASATPLKADGAVELLSVGSDPIPFTLRSLKGTDVKLQDLLAEKKAVLMIFWSLFCGPCKEELPLIDALAKKYADKDLVVLGINLDGEARGKKPVEKYIEKNNFTFVVLWEVMEGTRYTTADPYGVAGTPTLLLIGKKGKISHAHVGQEDEAALDKAIQAALAE